MIETYDRKFSDINGILNMCTHLFGVQVMCKVKYLLGKIRGRKYKKDKLSELNQYIRKGLPDDDLMSIDEKSEWTRSFRHLLDRSNDILHWNMIYEFYNAEMEMIKDFEKESDKEPILLCAERNEILRIKKFLEHYRMLGVERFLILDNDSSDGTREYLLKQPDVRLYLCKEQYNAQRKSAWQNRMVADYGLNHWYLYVDADEFIWYPEAATIRLPDYTKAIYEKGICAVKGIMIEMYPKGVIGSAEYDKGDFMEQYRFFDGDSDDYTYDADTNTVYGGMLARLFGVENLLRTKVPLYYHTKDRFLVGSHHIFPLKDDITAPFAMLMKHYKFIPGDEEKVREAIRNQNYANHSMMYRRYVEFYDSENGISGYHEGSCEWSEDSTDEFTIIKKIV